jgi:hypothetical protein
MSDAPPPAWRDAVGKAAAAAWHADQVEGDMCIERAWKDPRLSQLAPEEAAAACIAIEKEREAAGDAKLLAEGFINACIIWRMGYIQEWTWLVHGECDFEADDGEQWLTDMWHERGAEDPAAVAREDFEKVFDAGKRESYRVRREELLWRPPAD